MGNPKSFAGVSSKWQTNFNEKGISEDMLGTVVEFLAEMGVLNLCGTPTGCDGSCPDGQSCDRVGKNCVCRKDPIRS